MISTVAQSLTSTASYNSTFNLFPPYEVNSTNYLQTSTWSYIYTSTSTIDPISNTSNLTFNESHYETASPVFPSYIRTISMVFCIVIMCLGVIGNIMVPIVIFKTKDMRNSTNIFLVNLSVADLMVLLVCTPTVLVEVNSRPETWVLGEEMCKAVPFVELTVAHASVLTILAISFERYYAICKPLKAGYICTKARASLICLLAWIIAAVFTSPILGIAVYHEVEYYDDTRVPACQTLANTFWSALYFLGSIFLFFFVPFVILIILYLIIAKNLISNASTIVLNKHIDSYSIRARKQVILMLGTVVISFFVCLIPFRVFTLWIIIVPDESVYSLGVEKYYNILYFCRIMVYLNSAMNPILYNLMSSKFRTGFIICSEERRRMYLRRSRNGTFSTTATSYRSSTYRNSHDGYKVCYKSRNNSVLIKNFTDSPDSNRSSDSHINILRDSPVFRNHLRNESIKNVPADEVNDASEISYGKNCKANRDSRAYSVLSENVIIFPDAKYYENVPKSINTDADIINLHEKYLKQINKNEEESFV